MSSREISWWSALPKPKSVKNHNPKISFLLLALLQCFFFFLSLQLLFTFTIRIIFIIDSLLLFWGSFQFIWNIAAKNQSHQLVIVAFLLTQDVSFSTESLSSTHTLTNFIRKRHFFPTTLLIISTYSKPPMILPYKWLNFFS